MMWFQKSASGAIDRSVSHFVMGKVMVVSDLDIILYILDRSFFVDLMLISSELGGGRWRSELTVLHVVCMDDLI